MKSQRSLLRLTAIMAVFLILAPAEMRAHCDTMDGPVVKAALRALDSGDVRFALVWVKPAGEAEVRTAFEKATVVRTQGEDARLLADQYFFETVVRVHRAGEGAPYTGLKAAGTKLEPGIAAAEHAIEENSQKALTGDLTALLQGGLESAFHRVQDARAYNPQDVEAGRRYVEAYVNYLHYVERLYGTLGGEPPQHNAPSGPHEH